MSALSDAITAVNTALVQLEADLTAEIAEINKKISEGTVTQADLDNLTALATRLGTVSADVKNIIP